MRKNFIHMLAHWLFGTPKKKKKRRTPPPMPEPEVLPPLQDESGQSALIMKDVHVKDGLTTNIEVRADGIHLQRDDEEEERIIPINEFDRFKLSEVDEEIRLQIARKITLLMPELGHSKREALLRYVFRVLLILAEDQMTRVREMIAEELRDSFDAPHHLIRRLAWDNDISVAAPILEFSPLLSETDMIEIIAQSDIPGVLDAISSRKDVPEDVTDAIVKNVTSSKISKGDATVIQRLLENQGAHFREDTLEIVAEEAPQYEAWHRPLVDRPEMTTRIVNKVARYVSQGLILELQDRGMISKEVGRNLTFAIANRLQNPGVDRAKEADKLAKELYDQGELTPEVVMDALESGEREFVLSAIAVLSEFSRKIVERIMRNKEPEDITALAWKAGLSMRDAITLQLRLAKVPHTNILYAKDGTDFPMNKERMVIILRKYIM